MPRISDERGIVNTRQKVSPVIFPEKLHFVNHCILFSLAGPNWLLTITGHELNEFLAPSKPSRIVAAYIRSGALIAPEAIDPLHPAHNQPLW